MGLISRRASLYKRDQVNRNKSHKEKERNPNFTTKTSIHFQANLCSKATFTHYCSTQALTVTWCQNCPPRANPYANCSFLIMRNFWLRNCRFRSLLDACHSSDSRRSSKSWTKKGNIPSGTGFTRNITMTSHWWGNFTGLWSTMRMLSLLLSTVKKKISFIWLWATKIIKEEQIPKIGKLDGRFFQTMKHGWNTLGIMIKIWTTNHSMTSTTNWSDT